MPEKSDLQFLEEFECSTVDDWKGLALQALDEFADQDFAIYLARRAEIECQGSVDYVELAEFVSEFLSDSEYAEKLLVKAEEACSCFEPSEYVEVANAWTVLLGNSDRGLAIVCEAAEEFYREELYYLVNFAAKVGEQELANLLTKLAEGYPIQHYEYIGVAQQLKSSSNVEAAKRVVEVAERDLTTVSDSVEHAKAIIQLFDDQSKALEIMESAKFNCDCSEDYIALASGFKEVLCEPRQIDYLLEKAVQIAALGEDFVDLAYAWLELKNDRGAAYAIFRQAVPDIFAPSELQKIAVTAMREFSDPDLALQCYQKTTETITNPDDLVQLIAEGWETLGDEWVYYTRQLIDTVKAKLPNALDLVALAESVIQTLNDRDMVCEIYRDAITTCESFSELERILANQHATLNDAVLTCETLDRMKLLAADSAELVATFTAARSSSQNPEICRSILVDAENAAVSPTDLESVIAAVRDFAPDDPAWMSNLEDKLGSR